jgi:hypothetical protein
VVAVSFCQSESATGNCVPTYMKNKSIFYAVKINTITSQKHCANQIETNVLTFDDPEYESGLGSNHLTKSRLNPDPDPQQRPNKMCSRTPTFQAESDSELGTIQHRNSSQFHQPPTLQPITKTVFAVRRN